MGTFIKELLHEPSRNPDQEYAFDHESDRFVRVEDTNLPSDARYSSPLYMVGGMDGSNFDSEETEYKSRQDAENHTKDGQRVFKVVAYIAW